MTQSPNEKLQKVLARAGFGSRRDMEQAIIQGRVKVDGKVAHLGMRVDVYAQIQLDNKTVHLIDEEAKPMRVILYNKPEGEICTRNDPEGRRTVFESLPRLRGERWIAIGRLDINTSGLLLFTTDGELANCLMHPKQQIEREYAVRITGYPELANIKAMVAGVMLEDGIARFTDVQQYGRAGLNTWFHVVLIEGRNREVRRLWESQGLQVSRLKRVRFGNIFLDQRAKAGRWLELSQEELTTLYQMANLAMPKITTTLEPKDRRQKIVKVKDSAKRVVHKSTALSENKSFRANITTNKRRQRRQNADEIWSTQAPEARAKKSTVSRQAKNVHLRQDHLKQKTAKKLNSQSSINKAKTLHKPLYDNKSTTMKARTAKIKAHQESKLDRSSSSTGKTPRFRKQHKNS